MTALFHWSVWRRLRLVAFLLLIPSALGASTNSTWLVRIWQSDDGLPNNTVTGLTQTPDGYLWVANSGQLARFDGSDFEAYRSTSLAGFDQKTVSVLHSRAGDLWLGMDHGPLIRLHEHSAQVFTNNLPDLIAWTLTEDKDGAIWITYGGNTICRFKEGVVKNFTQRTNLPIVPGAGCSLAHDKQGRIWLGTAGKVLRFENEHFEIACEVGLSNTPVRLAGARDGGIWICSGFQLMKLDIDGDLAPLAAFQPDSPAAEPSVVMEDQKGSVWIGTSSSGLFRYEAQGFEQVFTSHGKIQSLFEDRDGHIWVGTGGGGLNCIQPRAIEVEPLRVGAAMQAVQSICETTNGILWATTDTGTLMWQQDGEWSVVSNWPGAKATCVVSDRSGAVWIGTRDRQIHCWRNGAFTTLSGLPSKIVHAMAAGSNGDLWIGGEVPENLLRLRNGQMQNLPLPAGIRIIRAMAEDASGNLWLGTSKGVLLRVTGDQVFDETLRTTGSPLSIRCLYATKDGSLWIGYVGGGVGRFKNGNFARISSDQGLYDDVISQIVADDRGWMWFGSDRGIFRIKCDELADVAEGRLAQVRSIHHGRDEGLPSLQASAGDSPGALRTRDGRLCIPMLTGVAVVNPENLRENPLPPAVLLKRVAVDDRTVAYYGGAVPVQASVDLQGPETNLRLDPSHHRLDFEFTALTFDAPENVHFRYRLDGIDNKWIEAGTQRHASYSRLSAGNYHFNVSACNGVGVWSRADAMLTFSVAPFFWQTWWFRSLALALFAVSGIATGRYVSFRRLRRRLRELERKAALDRERARIAKDIHDDLGGSLTQTGLLLNLTQRSLNDSGQADAYLKQVSMKVREVVTSLDEIVWAVNPGNDMLPHFVDYVGQFTVEFLRAAGLRYRIDLPDEPPERPLAPEVRHNLFLVLKEALNNAVRHARATEVRLQIAVTRESLTMTIEDDGCGFNPQPQLATADGLQNMRQRLDEIGGRFAVESAPRAGTRVSVFLPWSYSETEARGYTNGNGKS